MTVKCSLSVASGQQSWRGGNPFGDSKPVTSIINCRVEKAGRSCDRPAALAALARSVPSRRRIAAAVAVSVALPLRLHCNVSRRGIRIALAVLNRRGRTVVGLAPMLGGGGDLDCGQYHQRRSCHRQNCPSHFLFSLDPRLCEARRFASRACSNDITMADDDFYRARYHEAASKFLGQRFFPAKYSSANASDVPDAVQRPSRCSAKPGPASPCDGPRISSASSLGNGFAVITGGARRCARLEA
jgi:hypothetical protein